MCRLFERIMKLYFFENYKELFPDLTGQCLTDRLIIRALEEYGTSACRIHRTDRGKPYVDEDVHLSVSHSGEHFVCLISEKLVGVDIQKARRADMTKISRRYFTREECDYADEAGSEGFFLLWTRKEVSRLPWESVKVTPEEQQSSLKRQQGASSCPASSPNLPLTHSWGCRWGNQG